MKKRYMALCETAAGLTEVRAKTLEKLEEKIKNKVVLSITDLKEGKDLNRHDTVIDLSKYLFK